MRERLESHLEWLLEGTGLAPEDLLKAILVAGLVFSFIHLLTMLVTRWGDSRASTKALVFSLLVHVSCVLGLVANADPRNFVVAADDPEDEPVRVRELVIDDPDGPPDRERGNSAIWNRVAEPEEAEAERRDVDPREPVPTDDPARLLREERAPEPFEIADARPNVDREFETPDPEDVIAGRSRAKLPDQPEIEKETTRKRDDVTVPSPGSRRAAREVAGVDSDLVRRTPDAGGVPVQRPEVRPLPSRVDASPLPSPIRLDRDSPVGETIGRRTGPAPAPIERNAGSDPASPADSGPGGTPSPRRLAKGSSRSGDPEDAVGGSLVRRRPSDVEGIGRPSRLDGDDAGRRAPPAIADLDRETPLARPSFEGTGPKQVDPPSPTARRLDPVQRRDLARKRGGSPESEAAVDRALAWLASVQNPAGYWDADRFGAGRVKWVAVTGEGEQPIDAADVEAWRQRVPVVDRDNAGKDADTGITGLALLAFLAAGENEFDGRYARTVRSATDWLLEQQAPNGALHGTARYYAQMYCHAIATFALAEATRTHLAYDSPEVERLREALRKAVQLIVDLQNPADGGWRYRYQNEAGKSDVSVFGWQLMALVTAEKAGVPIPEQPSGGPRARRELDTRQLMIEFLKDRSLDENGRPSPTGGLASYRPNERVTPAMTAEALFCKQRLGLSRDNAASTQAVEYLRRNLPDREAYNLYYWYYGTLAMFHHGGDPWSEWNDRMRDLLVADQVATGEDAGSWQPRSLWAAYGGRVYSTAMATLCLESYYRFFEQTDDLAERAGPGAPTATRAR